LKILCLLLHQFQFWSVFVCSGTREMVWRSTMRITHFKIRHVLGWIVERRFWWFRWWTVKRWGLRRNSRRKKLVLFVLCVYLWILIIFVLCCMFFGFVLWEKNGNCSWPNFFFGNCWYRYEEEEERRWWIVGKIKCRWSTVKYNRHAIKWLKSNQKF